MLNLICSVQGSLDKYTARLTDSQRWSMFRGAKGGILGAHLVELREADLDLRVLVVRISNGACIPNGSGFAGRLYYSALDFLPDAGWKILHDRAPAAPGAHIFDAGRQMIRRVALYRGAVTEQQARSELDRVDGRKAGIGRSSWGPAGIRLPTINLGKQEAVYSVKLGRLRLCLASGKADPNIDMHTPAYGPFHFPGDPASGEPGGEGIYFGPLEQSPSALIYARTMADLWQERMTTACWNKLTGARMTSEDWADGAGSPWQPFETFGDGDEEARDQYAKNKAPHFPPALNPDLKWNQGSCAYENELRIADTIDDQHWIRCIRHAINAAWCLEDRASIDWLCDSPHHLRMSFCEIGPTAGQDQYSRSLRTALVNTLAHPGSGGLGRRQGWRLYASAAWKALARTKDEALIADRYLHAFLEWAGLARMASGLAHRAIYGSDAASIWDSFGMPKDQDAARIFEDNIVTLGELAAKRRMGRLPLEPRSKILKAAASLYDNPAFPPKPYDGAKQYGPPNCVAVAPRNGKPYEHLTLGKASDPAHVEPLLCELYRATLDDKWLEKLLVYGYPHKSLEEKRDWCLAVLNGEIQLYDAEWIVPTAGLLQEVLG